MVLKIISVGSTNELCLNLVWFYLKWKRKKRKPRPTWLVALKTYLLNLDQHGQLD